MQVINVITCKEIRGNFRNHLGVRNDRIFQIFVYNTTLPRFKHRINLSFYSLFLSIIIFASVEIILYYIIIGTKYKPV